MIIYLPFGDFQECAASLPVSKLGEQRKDAYKLLEALLSGQLEGVEPGLVRMWQGYEGALAGYNIALSKEMDSRGYHDPFFFQTFLLAYRYGLSFVETKAPPWLGEPSLHASHRSLLKREVTGNLAKASFAYKNSERLNLGVSKEELEAKLNKARGEFEWYRGLGWTDSMSAPLIWPQK